MEQQLIELTETKNLQKLYNFFTYYEQNGDKVRAEKVKDLLKKDHRKFLIF